MGGGISVHNETDVEIIVTLSQVGPLHWKRIEPGDTKKIGCGQVWFTVTARLWDNKEPTGWDVAKPFVVGFGAGTAAVAVGAILAPFVLVGEGAAAGAGAGVVAAEGAAAGTGALVTVEGAAAAAGIGAMGGGVGVGSALATQGNKSPETLQCENYEAWIGITPSKRSAEWLAANRVVAVVPAKERGVYANGKTITIRQELVEVSGSTRMTLKIIGA